MPPELAGLPDRMPTADPAATLPGKPQTSALHDAFKAFNEWADGIELPASPARQVMDSQHDFIGPDWRVQQAAREAQERDREKAAYSWSEGFTNARLYSNATGQVFMGLLRPEAIADPDFRMTEETYDMLTKGLPLEYHDEIAQAVSLQHGYAIRLRIEQELEVERRLDAMPFWSRLTAEGAAGAADPIGLVMGMAGGAWAAARAVGRGRAIATAYGAGAGAVTGAATQSIAVSASPVIKSDTIVTAGIAGLLFGGALDGLLYKPRPSGGPGGGGGPGDPPNPPAGAADDVLDIPDPDPGTPAAQPPTTGDLRAGAEAASAIDGRPAFARARGHEVAVQLGTSENAVSRVAGGTLVQDVVGRPDRARAAAMTVEEDALQLRQRAGGMLDRGYVPSFQDWARRNGHPPLGGRFSPDAQKQFDEAVERFLEDRMPHAGAGHDPAVVRAGETYRETLAWLAENQRNPGLSRGRSVAGVENATFSGADPHFVLRRFGRARVMNALARIADGNGRPDADGLSRLFAKGFMAQNPAIDFAAAHRIGSGVAQRLIGSTDDAALEQVSRALSGQDPNGLRAILRDDAGMAAADIDALFARLDPAGRRGRLDLDMDAAMRTTDGTQLRIRDLMEASAYETLRQHMQRATGEIAFARWRIPNPLYGQPGQPRFLVSGIRSQADWDRFIESVKDVGREINVSPDKDIANLNFARDRILGIAHAQDATMLGSASRTLRNFLQSGITLGSTLVSLSDVFHLVSQHGLMTSFRTLPALGSFRRSLQTGARLDDSLHELEAVFGAGGQLLQGGRSDISLESAIIRGEMPEFLGRLESMSRVMRDGVTYGSGFSWVSERLSVWAMSAARQTVTDTVLRTGAIPEALLKDLGISPAMAVRIAQQIQARADFVPGSTTRLRVANVEAWQDLAAAETYRNATRRLAMRTVVEGNIGQMHRFMSHPFAEILMQARALPLIVHSKVVLHNLSMRDRRTVSTFLFGTIGGSLTYMVNIYLQSIGRSDQRAYLKERLSWDRIAAGAIANAPWAGMLPLAADTALSVVAKPVFNRDNKTTFDVLVGDTPPGNLVKSVGSFGRILRSPLTGEPVTQEDIRAAVQGLPGSTLMPVVMLTNILAADLPPDRQALDP